MVEGLLEPNAGGVVPRGHVGDDDAVANGEPVDYLDGVHGSATELHVHAVGIAVTPLDLEQADRAFRLAVGRATDVEHVLQAIDLDRAVDAEVRARAIRQRTVEPDL